MAIQRLIGVAVVAVAIVLGAWFLPLSTTPIRIVKVVDTPHAISVSAGDHVTQRVHLSKGLYSGVAIFSNDSMLSGRIIHAVIRNREGAIVARGDSDTSTYRGDGTLRIEIGTTWFTVTHDDFYVLDISYPHGASLSLRIMDREKNLPAVQKLSINNESKPAIMSLSFMQRTTTDFGARQGVIVGAIAMIGVALISLVRTNRNKMIAAIALIIVLAPLAIMGYFFPTGDLGIADWDLYVSLHDSYRKALLVYHTFPFWDPYPCGGTAGLGDPEFPVFTPTFLLVLLFGSSMGLRLDIVLSIIIGAIGMLVLARKLGRSVEAGLIASFAVAFGTVNLIESTEGHVNIMAWMWVPWILWAWLLVYEKKIKPLVCGIFLALTFLGGGVYLLIYTTLAFVVLTLMVRRHREAFLASLYSGLWGVGLVSFKLIPVVYWLHQFTDRVYVPSSYTLPWLVDILFGRYLHGSTVILNQSSGWHEYGAYIGYGVLVLALIGLAGSRQRVIRSLGIATVLALCLSTLGPFLAPLLDHIKFFPRSNLSRVILFAVIPLALLASFGMDRLASRIPRYGKTIMVVIIGIVAIDIISLTYQISEQAFVLPHVMPLVSPAPFPIAYTPDRYDQAGQGSRTTRTVDAYFAGYGTEAYCSVLGPKSAVRTVYDQGDNGIVSALSDRATVLLVSWNYNKVVVHVDTPVPTQIVLNANYADGWKANGAPATIVSNRIAAFVDSGSHDIAFEYHAPGLLLGGSITACTIIFGLWRFIRKKHSGQSK